MNEMTSNFRLLHTMIRVMDMDRSIDFYTRILGMKLLRRQDYEMGRFTLSFVGYGDEESDTVAAAVSPGIAAAAALALLDEAGQMDPARLGYAKGLIDTLPDPSPSKRSAKASSSLSGTPGNCPCSAFTSLSFFSSS